MSEAPAIRIENVSKSYRLGAGVQHSFSERLAGGIRSGVRRALRVPMPEKGGGDEFWALRDINLEVAQGDKVGVIGANGAGKSTLLKLLSRITFPTEGTITLDGRVGSLLEVGTGFDPELTGRENVFLNGAILGMKRTEIANRYNEIVEFAEIEQFMETPVKRYSSGMFVRLAFSVAVYLKPDILLLDEVLSVGDAQFQRKSLDKMNEIVQDEGTTLVFVSHGAQTIRKLCNRAVYLDHGLIKQQGPANKVLDDYLYELDPVRHGGTAEVSADESREGTGEARIVEAALSNHAGEPCDRVRFGEPFTVSLTFDVKEPIPDAIVGIGIGNLDGVRGLTALSSEGGRGLLSLEPGTLKVKARIDATLVPGEFVIAGGISDEKGQTIDYVERLISLTALQITAEGSDDEYPWELGYGFVRPDSEWEIEAAPTKAVAEAAPAPSGSPARR